MKRHAAIMEARDFRHALGLRGYSLKNSQDGAHELYHALTCGLPLHGGTWFERECLNYAIERRFPGIERWWNEVEARVVERLVCTRLGAEDELLGFDEALYLSLDEAKHFGVPYASFASTRRYAITFGTSKRARAAVDLLLAYAKREASIGASDWT